MVCPLAAWGQTNWIDESDINWYNDSESSFEISTAAELAGLAQLVNGGNTFEGKTITLANDIVLNEGVLNENGELNGDGSNFKQWTPIGNTPQFNGIFDGNNYIISGIYIKDANSGCQGLFGYVDNKGEIKNVRVEDSYFDVDYSVGGIVGYNYGTVSNCSNSGTVIDTNTHTDVGGIVGENGGTVTNCSNSGTVTGSGGSARVGGVVGRNIGTVSNCSNSGTVTGLGQYAYVGGVVGSNENTEDNTVTVSNCSNSGVVTGNNYVGGVVG